MGMLTSSLRRYVCHGSFHNLEQRLLHTLAGHVAGNGDIFTLSGDLIDLVHIDNAALSQFHVIIRCLKQTKENVLYIVSDITGLCQRSGVCNGKRNLQDTGKCLGKKSLAGTRRAKHQNVALLQFHIISTAEKDAFIMIIDGNGKRNLGRILADDILIQHIMNLSRCWQFLCGSRRFTLHGITVLQNIAAEVDAFIADANPTGALNHAMYLTLLFAAERAAQGSLIGLAHI